MLEKLRWLAGAINRWKALSSAIIFMLARPCGVVACEVSSLCAFLGRFNCQKGTVFKEQVTYISSVLWIHQNVRVCVFMWVSLDKDSDKTHGRPSHMWPPWFVCVCVRERVILCISIYVWVCVYVWVCMCVWVRVLVCISAYVWVCSFTNVRTQGGRMEDLYICDHHNVCVCVNVSVCVRQFPRGKDSGELCGSPSHVWPKGVSVYTKATATNQCNGDFQFFWSTLSSAL